jgi:hypothetical protein
MCLSTSLTVTLQSIGVCRVVSSYYAHHHSCQQSRGSMQLYKRIKEINERSFTIQAIVSCKATGTGNCVRHVREQQHNNGEKSSRREYCRH